MQTFTSGAFDKPGAFQSPFGGSYAVQHSAKLCRGRVAKRNTQSPQCTVDLSVSGLSCQWSSKWGSYKFLIRFMGRGFLGIQGPFALCRSLEFFFFGVIVFTCGETSDYPAMRKDRGWSCGGWAVDRRP